MDGTDQDWYTELVDLRHRDGDRSSRTIAKSCDVSHAYISQIFSGARRPTLRTLLKIVDTLNGDREHFADLYSGEPVESRKTHTDILEAILTELQTIRGLLETRKP